MEVNCVIKNEKKYIEAVPGKVLLRDEEDALDLLGCCGSHQTNRIMLHTDNLTADFFDLKTRVAGNILQKFTNYRIRLAVVMSPDLATNDKFNQMVLEANKGGPFRFFRDREEASQWLTQ